MRYRRQGQSWIAGLLSVIVFSPVYAQTQIVMPDSIDESAQSQDDGRTICEKTAAEDKPEKEGLYAGIKIYQHVPPIDHIEYHYNLDRLHIDDRLCSRVLENLKDSSDRIAIVISERLAIQD